MAMRAQLLALALVLGFCSGASASSLTMSETIAAIPDLSTFYMALSAANLTATIDGIPGENSIFCPDNTAFSMLSSMYNITLDNSTLAFLANTVASGRNDTILQALLKYHFIPGQQLAVWGVANPITDGEMLPTAEGEDMYFHITNYTSVNLNQTNFITTTAYNNVTGVNATVQGVHNLTMNGGVVNRLNGVLFPAALSYLLPAMNGSTNGSMYAPPPPMNGTNGTNGTAPPPPNSALTTRAAPMAVVAALLLAFAL
jgi:uncharacterized surface protein with fasciclin (FAS1) repeats